MKKLTALFSALLVLGCSNSGTGGSSTPTIEPKPSPYDKFCKNISFASGHNLKYCVRSHSWATRAPSLIYFLHGAGGGAKDIFEVQFNTAYEQLKEKLTGNTPFVVGLSFGESETIPIEPGALDPLSLHELIDIAMPRIERELGFYTDGKDIPVRNLMGLSLGGFNALNLAAKSPGTFRSVAALCPALIHFDPFDDGAVQQYMNRNVNVINAKWIVDTIGLLRQKFQTPTAWSMSDPFAELSAGKFQGTPIYMSTGDQDDFGFYEGAVDFQRLALMSGVSIHWAPTTGKHCSFDGPALLEFLSAQAPR